MEQTQKRLQEEYDKAVSLVRGQRWERIKTYPLRLTTAKVLYLISELLPVPIHCTAKPFWGGKMRVVLPEPMSHAVLRYGYCEMDMSAMLLKVMRPGMTFFDIGAHFGYATLLGATLVGETGQVHAFEPTPSSFKILKMNTASIKNIHINNVAVYSKTDRLTFNDFGLKSSTLNSFFAPRVEQSSFDMPATVYQVQTLSLDEYVEKTGIIPNVVKIDAESAELEILMGMKKLLNEARPAVIMEVGDLPGSTVSSVRLVEFLTEQQYNVYGYAEGRLEAVKEFTNSKYEPGNRLFVHTSKIDEVQ